MKGKRWILKLLAMLAVLVGGFADVRAMTVDYNDGLLRLYANVENNHLLTFEFSECMANRLFTFSRVMADSVVANKADSDNIGPFLLEGRGWTGGNHLAADGVSRTAKTVDIHVMADGRTLLEGMTVEAELVAVKVRNYLYDPIETTLLFAVEDVTYTVCGNSIQADVRHYYMNEDSVKVSRYYGMQSMSVGETDLFTPGGLYGKWTPIAGVDRFAFGEYPAFRLFVEKLPGCYAAAYLLERGLGSHSLLKSDDYAFIGNSWTKCYHNLISGHFVKKGDTDSWSGVYSWFFEPLEETAESLCYESSVNGKRCRIVCTPAGVTEVFEDDKHQK